MHSFDYNFPLIAYFFIENVSKCTIILRKTFTFFQYELEDKTAWKNLNVKVEPDYVEELKEAQYNVEAKERHENPGFYAYINNSPAEYTDPDTQDRLRIITIAYLCTSCGYSEFSSYGDGDRYLQENPDGIPEKCEGCNTTLQGSVVYFE